MIRQASNLAQILVVAAAGIISSILLYLMTDGLFGNRTLAAAVCAVSLLVFFSRALLALAVLGYQRALAYWRSRQGR
jgi:4-amino-4-deoxy-L-arabinose transferase-like glycosyltransferase